ncbi:hypothetical protein [Micromonospora sp. NPDC050276]|uniref:hypothetical protein n=1 Tax=Micromonospora sp. NPDC050276 TaxID=3364278 RepID=UPI0037B1C802
MRDQLRRLVHLQVATEGQQVPSAPGYGFSQAPPAGLPSTGGFGFPTTADVPDMSAVERAEWE